jgi:hypothetical protein
MHGLSSSCSRHPALKTSSMTIKKGMPGSINPCGPNWGTTREGLTKLIHPSASLVSDLHSRSVVRNSLNSPSFMKSLRLAAPPANVASIAVGKPCAKRPVVSCHTVKSRVLISNGPLASAELVGTTNLPCGTSQTILNTYKSSGVDPTEKKHPASRGL